MKFSKILIFIFFVALFFTMSCRHLEPKHTNGDYYLGTHAGEIAAKKDALAYRCIHYPTHLPHLIRKNIKVHLKRDGNKHSETYVRGFKWGYDVAFRDYTDTYCGGDNRLKLLKK